MDLMNNLVDSDTFQLTDPLIPFFLEFLKNNHYELVLVSSTTQDLTKGMLGDLIHFFDEKIFKIHTRELTCLGKDPDEMIFFSGNFSSHSHQWHLPFDTPLSVENIELVFGFTNHTPTMSVSKRILRVRHEWNHLRAHVFEHQRHLLWQASHMYSCTMKIPEIYDPSLKLRYRPPQQHPKLPHTEKTITLCLDLDGTLVHTEHSHLGLIVNIRPYARHFLQEIAKMKDKFEVVLFTASNHSYASKVIQQVDRHSVVDHILHRVHCSQVDQHYVKELRKIGRANAVIVDDNHFSFLLNHEDAIPIRCWSSEDAHDRELLHVLDVIRNIHLEDDPKCARLHISRYRSTKRTYSQ